MSARIQTKYSNDSAKFLIQSFDYQKQFSHLYSHRLVDMTNLLKDRSQKKWGEKYSIFKVCELREEQQDTCIIIGTIYKHQAYKPSILREISEENQLAPQPPRLHYADPEDKLILEDELQRVRLYGKVDVQKMATGVVWACLGNVEENGRFEVKELLYYESGPQRPLPKLNSTRLIVIASGLSQLESHNYVDSLNIFQHWLAGNLFRKSGTNSKQIVRLIIAGNSVRSASEGKAEPKDAVQAMKTLDEWFAAWSRSLPVDVMPGAFDPANYMMPQQPFHSCMFPKAARNSSFRSVSNPYACSVDDALIVGCSGQNIDDLLRCTMLEQPIEALRSSLIWGHIAPTAPDTLSCFPYIDSDPFILRDCPHVYFAGNCDSFATELHTSSDNKQTRLICVPKFSKTRSVSVVDLETLDCHEICFNVPSN